MIGDDDNYQISVKLNESVKVVISLMSIEITFSAFLSSASSIICAARPSAALVFFIKLITYVASYSWNVSIILTNYKSKVHIKI